MKPDLVILRPTPGAEATARRAAALGLSSVSAPLFKIHGITWDPPRGVFDAVLLTSANAVRMAGLGLTPHLSLPCFAVGESTAAVAIERGFTNVRAGPSDGKAIVELMAGEGVRSVFHPCGRDHVPLQGQSVKLTSIAVYEAIPIEHLPNHATEALLQGALVLIHSPAAGRLFASLIDRAGVPRSRIRVAAISEAAASAAGSGWALCRAAVRPRDEALLELAEKLCKADRE